MNHGQVTSGGSPVEVVTTYTEDEISDLQFTQSADTLFIAHPSHAPRKVTRSSHTSWAIADIDFLDGPYLPVNGAATTLTFGATTGSTTCTASAITGINDDTGFQSTDVGRHIRAKTTGGVWGWAKITAVTDTTHVNVDIQEAMGATTATANWRLGAWTSALGYPRAICFHQDRLGWGGAGAIPQTLTFSKTGDYYNHQPTAYDTSGTVADDNGLSYTLNSGDVQIIRWMQGDSQGLLVGTQSGEWIVSPSSLNEALTPTNVNAVQMTGYGSAGPQAVRVGYTSLFLQRGSRKIRELAFVYVENRYHAPDMSVLASHITRGGVKEMAFQLEPQGILWCTRNDGILLGLTYERDQNVVGWHWHPLGGVSDADGTAPIVESVAVIPEPNGTYDEVWMVVKRYINGATVRYVEYMTKIWENGDSQETAVYVDCALVYDDVPTTTISGLDQLEGETVTILADGAAHPDKTVSGGSITLDREASAVVVGYGYNSDGQTLRNDAGAADGTAQGKYQRTHRVTFRLQDSLGLTAGPSFDQLSPHIVRTGGDELGAAVSLFSGDDSDTWEGDYSLENTICWRWSQPFPGTVVALMPQLVTQDR
jgi:hypothetical protein